MTNSPYFLQNILVTFAEIMVLVILFFVILKLVDNSLQRTVTWPFFKDHQGMLQGLQGHLKGWLTILFAVIGLALVGIDAYLVYQSRNVWAESLQFVRNAIPQRLWLELGLDLLQIIGLIILARLVMAVLNQLLPELQRRAKQFEQLQDNDQSIDNFFTMLLPILKNGLRLLVVAVTAVILPVPEIAAETLLALCKIYLIIAIGRLIVKMVVVIVDTLDGLSQKYIQTINLEEFYEQLRGLIPLFNRTLEYIIYVQAASLAVAQINVIAEFAQYGTILTQLIGIAFLSRVVVEILNLLVDKLFPITDDLPEIERQQRLTFTPLIKSFLRYAIYFAAFLWMLNTLGFNTTPILAAIGGIGLIVGLAAQPVLNDLLSGIFILFENLYLVGDYIETAEARGIVEAIDIRTTHIRDPDGQLHLIRNGQIGDIANFSKGYIYAVVQVGVTYETDLDHAFQIIDEVGQTLSDMQEDVLAPTAVQGVEEFGDFGLFIRTVTKAKPGRHYEVGFELRTRLKRAFDREGIDFAVENERIHIALPGETQANGRFTPDTPQS